MGLFPRRAVLRAHAIQRVACPTNGLTVVTAGSAPNFCAAGTIGYKTIYQLTSGKSQISPVVGEYTNWNWAVFYNSTGYIKLEPGRSSPPLPNVITYALEIDNPGFH